MGTYCDDELVKYHYEGPVKIFDKLVAEHWRGETIAVSESKAKANLAYQYKRTHKLAAAAKVTLTGKLTQVS